MLRSQIADKLVLVVVVLVCSNIAGCNYEPVDSTEIGTSSSTQEQGSASQNAVDSYNRLAQIESCDGICSCDEIESPFNDTGVSFAGDFPSTNLPDCQGQSNFVQDCDVGRDAEQQINANSDAFLYSKVDEQGLVIEDSSSQWSCVVDERTGLMWEVKSKNGSGDLQDSSFTYSWRDPSLPDYSSTNNGNCDERCDTQSYIERVNDMQLCGYSDWRLPSKTELQDLLNYDQYQPAITESYFPNSQNSFYWSASIDVDDTGSAWAVDFNVGRVAGGSVADARYVRLVRGNELVASSDFILSILEQESSVRQQFAPQQRCDAQVGFSSPVSRYKRDSQGNLLDLVTGLIWRQCVAGVSGENCEQGVAEKMDWQQAFEFAQSMNDENPELHAWRLPSIKELQQNIELACEEPPLNPIVFPNTPFGEVWSSTPSARDEGASYQYQYQNSIVFYSPRTSKHYVHLVHDCRAK